MTWPRILVIHLFSHELFRIEFSMPDSPAEECNHPHQPEYDKSSTTAMMSNGDNQRFFGIDTRQGSPVPGDVEARKL